MSNFFSFSSVILDFCFGDRKANFTICTFSVLMAIPLERPSRGAFALTQPKTRRGKLLPHCRIEQKTSQSQSTLAEGSHNNWPRRRWERDREKSVMQACKEATAWGSLTPEATLSPCLSLSFSLSAPRGRCLWPGRTLSRACRDQRDFYYVLCPVYLHARLGATRCTPPGVTTAGREGGER